MNKEQQLKYDQALIVSLSDEYNRVKEIADALRNDINSLDFEERVPDSQERYLLVEKLQTTEAYQTNLHNRIRFYRHRIKINACIKDWSQYKKTDRYNISVDVSSEGDHSACRPVCGDAIATEQEHHHCGQDADMDDACCQARAGRVDHDAAPAASQEITGDSMKDLLGMQVIAVGDSKAKCNGCPQDHYGTPCVKVELVGGTYLCLAPLPNSIITE